MLMTVTVVATDCDQILLFEPFDVFAPTPNFTPRLSPQLKLERGKPGMFHGMKYASYRSCFVLIASIDYGANDQSSN